MAEPNEAPNQISPALEQLQRLLNRTALEMYSEGYFKGYAAGYEEGLSIMAGLIRLKAAEKFPNVTLGKEVEAVGNIKTLANLYLRFDSFFTADMLVQRLAKLNKTKA